MTVGKYIAKAIGLGAVGFAAYETYHVGMNNGARETRNQYATQMADTFINHSASSTQNALGEGVKSWWRNMLMGSPILESMLGIKNFFVGVTHEAMDNIALFGLGAAALLTGSQSKNPILGLFGKVPLLGKLAAGLILFKVGHYVATDVLNIGSKNNFEDGH